MIVKILLYTGVLLSILSITTLSAQPNAIYRGGNGSGYGSIDVITTKDDYFLGGSGTGYSSDDVASAALDIYDGGLGTGYSSDDKTEVNTDYFKGGNGDGYASIFDRVPFIWTGAVGTSWTVRGNWNYNLIPGIFRPVIIPDGVPNWPFVNAGLFAIGDNPNGSNYRCASLWIQENAFLQTRVNNRIENYGLITIDGTMRVKKQTANAFQNFDDGVIRISQGGELIIQP